VDYAGLFPPAALAMPDAVKLYDQYRRGPDAWALGNFVLPAARLGEFEQAAQQLAAGGGAWPLSLLAGADFRADVRTIHEFAHRAGARATVAAIEGKASSSGEIAAIAELAALLRSQSPDPFDVYVEISVAADPLPLIEAIASRGLRAKVRTGGVVASAFPTSAQLVRFLRSCISHGVTFKATAGLHHAIRGRYPFTYDTASERGIMFGFLNVFLAALFMRDGLDDAGAAAVIDESDPTAFVFDEHGVTWRERTVTAAAIRAARSGTATSFGSCSFAEPIADLSALGLL
jgi:hypothetical protein